MHERKKPPPAPPEEPSITIKIHHYIHFDKDEVEQGESKEAEDKAKAGLKTEIDRLNQLGENK